MEAALHDTWILQYHTDHHKRYVVRSLEAWNLCLANFTLVLSIAVIGCHILDCNVIGLSNMYSYQTFFGGTCEYLGMRLELHLTQVR